MQTNHKVSMYGDRDLESRTNTQYSTMYTSKEIAEPFLDNIQHN